MGVAEFGVSNLWRSDGVAQFVTTPAFCSEKCIDDFVSWITTLCYLDAHDALIKALEM